MSIVWKWRPNQLQISYNCTSVQQSSVCPSLCPSIPPFMDLSVSPPKVSTQVICKKYIKCELHIRPCNSSSFYHPKYWNSKHDSLSFRQFGELTVCTHSITHMIWASRQTNPCHIRFKHAWLQGHPHAIFLIKAKRRYFCSVEDWDQSAVYSRQHTLSILQSYPPPGRCPVSTREFLHSRLSQLLRTNASKTHSQIHVQSMGHQPMPNTCINQSWFQDIRVCLRTVLNKYL